MHNQKYNEREIGKNLMLFESSLNEVFTKLMLDPSNQVLYQRAETTLELAGYVRDSLKKYDDVYIKNVVSKIESYQSKFEEIKDNIKACSLSFNL